MSLVLDEFYQDLRAVGVSSLVGSGMDDFFQHVKAAAVEYETVYKPEIEKMAKKRQDRETERRRRETEELKKEGAGKGEEVRLENFETNLKDVHSEPSYVQQGMEDDDTSDEDWTTGKLKYRDDS